MHPRAVRLLALVAAAGQAGMTAAAVQAAAPKEPRHYVCHTLANLRVGGYLHQPGGRQTPYIATGKQPGKVARASGQAVRIRTPEPRFSGGIAAVVSRQRVPCSVWDTARLIGEAQA